MGIAALFLISLIRCSSNSEQKLNDSSDIHGKWKLVEEYLSAGGPQYKVDVENGAEYVFLDNSTFVSSDFLGCKTGKFELDSNTNTLNLMYDCDQVQDYDGIISYRASLESGFLILVPKTIICTDGCRSIFKKI